MRGLRGHRQTRLLCERMTHAGHVEARRGRQCVARSARNSGWSCSPLTSSTGSTMPWARSVTTMTDSAVTAGLTTAAAAMHVCRRANATNVAWPPAEPPTIVMGRSAVGNWLRSTITAAGSSSTACSASRAQTEQSITPREFVPAAVRRPASLQRQARVTCHHGFAAWCVQHVPTRPRAVPIPVQSQEGTRHGEHRPQHHSSSCDQRELS